ncbi:alpha/beta fold hydrolase [Amycolatopsis sp. GM8]|uniref:alpha/beta fold hydrolase n=1 Tax=Amycolatopsis sp. GM8 TaxID=2896530 RepID=UPI001F306C19|nr:alpha/beta fold hydrolase [Amycolatopsis sp. GM8]
MPIIDVNEATIAYSDTGPRDAQPIVFGHGLLFSGWMFHRQIAALSDRYRCVTIDWRGQGDSPPARTGYDMDTLTGDAVALIEKLELAPVHWVGLSMGGFIGQRLAARHGELLRSLTLLDTSATAEGPKKSGRQRLLARVQQVVGIKALMSQVKPLLWGPEFRADPAGRAMIDEWVRRVSRMDRGAVRDAVFGVTERQPVTGELCAITVPTLVVVGADDVSTPVAESERIAAAIRGAELRVVPDCGHTSSLEQPAAITALLEKFLADA